VVFDEGTGGRLNLAMKFKGKSHPAPELFSTDRMLAFSDGLMAFAATLLIVGIHIPTASELSGPGGLLGLLGQAWPSYFSFFISFILITLIWFNHHEMFQHIKQADHTLFLMNAFLLMDIVLIPVAAGMLGECLLLSPENARTAAVIYGLVLMVGGIPFNLIWWHALKNPRLLASKKSKGELKIIGRHFARGPFLYAFATALAFWNVWGSLLFYSALIALYIAPIKMFLHSRKR
jgi:uncharacterized membrane protein